MPLTGTGRIVLAGVHVLHQAITEVQFRIGLMEIQGQQFVLIPIEEIVVMRYVHLPRAAVTDPVPRDLQGIPDLLQQREVQEAQGM